MRKIFLFNKKPGGIEMDDIERYDRFCKLRSEIRGSNKHLIVGIDVAKDKHHAFFGTAQGKTLWRRLIFTAGDRLDDAEKQ
jgi:hypothetical protein